jgi:hypothetical protein
MGLLYKASFADIALTNAAGSQDIWEIDIADEGKITIHGLWLSQSTEVGDAAEEGLTIQIIRGHTTLGSAGTAVTPRAVDTINTIAAGVTAVDRNNTTIASAGTAHALHTEVWNVRMPLIYVPTPEMRETATEADGTIVVRLLTTPADDLTASSTLVFEVG